MTINEAMEICRKIQSMRSKPDAKSLERIVVGALRSVINAHGPIGPESIGSAAKRICGALMSDVKYLGREPGDGE